MCSAAPCKSAVKDTHRDILGDVKEDLERPHATSRQAAPCKLRRERAGAVLGRLCDRRAGKGRGLPEGSPACPCPSDSGLPQGGRPACCPTAHDRCSVLRGPTGRRMLGYAPAHTWAAVLSPGAGTADAGCSGTAARRVLLCEFGLCPVTRKHSGRETLDKHTVRPAPGPPGGPPGAGARGQGGEGSLLAPGLGGSPDLRARRPCTSKNVFSSCLSPRLPPGTR